MLDHVVIGVADLDRSRAFYEAALAPLGLRVVLDRPGYIGFGDRRPFFFLADRPATARVHVAFQAIARSGCDGFPGGRSRAGVPVPRTADGYTGVSGFFGAGNRGVSCFCWVRGPTRD